MATGPFQRYDDASGRRFFTVFGTTTQTSVQSSLFGCSSRGGEGTRARAARCA
jgi:hypothetical protein